MEQDKKEPDKKPELRDTLEEYKQEILKERRAKGKNNLGGVLISAAFVVILMVYIVFFRSSEYKIPPPAAIPAPRAPEKAESAPARPAKADTEVVATPGPAFGGGSSIDPDSAELERRMTMSIDLCGVYAVSYRYLIPFQFLKLQSKKKGTYVVALPERLSHCLPARELVTFRLMEFDRFTFKPFRFRSEQQLRILARARYANFSQLLGDKNFIKNFPGAKIKKAGLKKFMEVHYGPSSPSQPLFVFKLKRDSQNPDKPPPLGVPIASPYAVTLAKTQVEEMLRAGAVAVDLRAEELYKQGTIPGAISFPIVKTTMATKVLTPDLLKNMYFRKERINSFNRTKPLILFTQNENNATAYNFVYILWEAGYTKLYYFRGGKDEWDSVQRATPEEHPKVQTIGNQQLQKLISSGALLVDVRDPDTYRKATIAGAVHLPFTEKKDAQDRSPTRKNVLDPVAMKTAGETVSIAGTKLQTASQIVVFGYNDNDWAALKVAYLLALQGKSNVSWLRRGFAEWVFSNKINAKSFRIAKPSAEERKKLPPPKDPIKFWDSEEDLAPQQDTQPKVKAKLKESE